MSKRPTAKRRTKNSSKTESSYVNIIISPPDSLEAAVDHWIRFDLTGSNSMDLINTISPHQTSTDPTVYQEFLDLHYSIQQLNLELLNTFDNYLCFYGDEDQAQFKNLSKMAFNRAMQALKSKEHQNSSVTETLFGQACEKLFEFYANENQEMVKCEENLAELISSRILEAYSEKMNGFFETGPSNINAVHQRLLKYCLGMLNTSLDFSAKMNNVHNLASQNLETAINSKFESLQQAKTQKPAPDTPPKPIFKPQTIKLTPIQECLQNYKIFLDAQYPQLASHQALRILHYDNIARFIQPLTPDDKITAKLCIRYYFSYISELFEASASIGTGRTICVNFANEILQIGINIDKTMSGDEVWTVDHKSRTATSVFKSKDKSKLTNDFIILLSKQGQVKLRSKMVDILRKIKKNAELKNGRFEQLCILVPTWLTLDHIHVLRELAHDADFKKAFFIRDTALAAYALYLTPNFHNQILVGVSVGLTGAFVEIYFRNGANALRLLSAAAYDWDFDDIATCQNKRFLCVKTTSVSKNARKSMTSQENPGEILLDTYRRAVEQLQENYKLETKYCFYIIDGESPMWLQACKEMIRKIGKKLVDIGPPPQNFATKTALALTKEPGKLRNTIFDHPVLYKEEMVLKENVAKGTPLNVRKTKDYLKVESQNYYGQGSVDRQELISTCNKMRSELDSGNVRLGVLSKRLIKEAIDKAETIAIKGDTTEEKLVGQMANLREYAKQYNFNSEE